MDMKCSSRHLDFVSRNRTTAKSSRNASLNELFRLAGGVTGSVSGLGDIGWDRAGAEIGEIGTTESS